MLSKETKINSQRIAIGVASGVGILACFMPWASLPIVGSISGAQGDGWIYAGMLLVPILLVFLGDKSKALDIKAKIASIGIGSIIAIMGIYMISNFNDKIQSATKSLADNPFSGVVAASVHIDFGLYLLILASIALVVCAALSGLFENKKAPKTEK